MKKKVLTIALVAIAAVGIICLSACDMSASSAAQVTTEAAKLIATEDLGVELSAVQYVTVERQVDNGSAYYEVEFNLDGNNYDYDIDVNSGTITKVEVNDEVVRSTTTVTPVPVESTFIGVDAAKEAAVVHAQLTVDDVVFTEGQLDSEDGVIVYEIDFWHNNNQYEYEINATTGAVVKVEINDGRATTVTPINPELGYIGVDSAKAAALAHAGVLAENATFAETQLDSDRGIYVYEIDFWSANNQYEYEINATTGAVIKVELNDRQLAVSEPVVAPETPTDFIGLEAAKANALTHAGIAAENAIFTDGGLDTDRGVYIYEVEFISGGYSYEYEINATTGAVVEFDKERD